MQFLFTAPLDHKLVSNISSRNTNFIFQYKIVAKIDRGRSPKRRVRDDAFLFGISSDILELSFYWRKHFRHFNLRS